MKKLSILVPAYNEEESIPLFCRETLNILDAADNYVSSILFINDGSNDNTEKVLKEQRVKDKRISYLSLSRNYGKEIAMIAGFDQIDADALIIMDCDLQHPPKYIPEMLRYFEEGYDDVYAKRINRKGEGFIKRTASNYFYRILKKTTRVEILPNVGDFRLLSRRMFNALRLYREKERYTKGFYSLAGYKKKEILFEPEDRVAGNTKWNYAGLFELAIDGITSFTTLPLRISTMIGIIAAIFSFVYFIFIFTKTIIFGIDVPGYASTMVTILFLSSVQLISIGILGEYIGRIFKETKSRPLYLIDEINGEKVELKDDYSENLNPHKILKDSE
ncbi:MULTISPECIES: glycosyltransferase family 2 protein [unclassified Oceanispirochaeta]|uniref:glycosyltransferase family 2 protein n=1 Tax=unclassified Oceanispirochaeta TaxID=2635722 RepID=UPI000E092B2D|nr:MULTISPECIES: glycosyltransferase family 2 protein [unclassified Oceanispirochaeta]MBF9017771.1 glycosyltransferase family 2 protein [Oceanispirochaeta sp. M2]NPD74335.1 glycosyltransferase family 2 protein [Oceanispirochaeta sp. M1]RDG29815.1 glycosyltransferase [Oceanispirochaeta sp. M1]